MGERGVCGKMWTFMVSVFRSGKYHTLWSLHTCTFKIPIHSVKTFDYLFWNYSGTVWSTLYHFTITNTALRDLVEDAYIIMILLLLCHFTHMYCSVYRNNVSIHFHCKLWRISIFYLFLLLIMTPYFLLCYPNLQAWTVQIFETGLASVTLLH